MKEVIIPPEKMTELLERLCGEILNDHPDLSKIILVGVQRRGADLAAKLSEIIRNKTALTLPYGSIDINLYRDDWTRLTDRVPQIGKSNIPDIDGKQILLVDDVLFSGRTVRAALEALLDYGRPEWIKLLVLIDRGHRELPIAADYIGTKLETARQWRVDVLTREHDGIDEVLLDRKQFQE